MGLLPLLVGAGSVVSGIVNGITGGITGSASFGAGGFGSFGGGQVGGGGGIGLTASQSSIPQSSESPRPNPSPLPSRPPTTLKSGPAPNPDLIPNTGKTRSYNWDISRGCLAPDGVTKCGIFINGQYPGPTLEADWGDMIQITIHNNITGPEEGTSFHWHGLLQKETPWMDGVPSVSQCPIAPGSSFTYNFRADQLGSSWYHAHYSAQYTDGLFGPMIIHGPSHVEYDIDIGPVLLNDYYHTPYHQNVQASIGKQVTPSSDNNLINGKMSFNCANANGLPCAPNAAVSTFRFQSSKKHRLRLINAGAEGLQRFRIDNHKLWIIANDFVPVQPYQVDAVTLAVGQRCDIIVEGTGRSSDAVWMRSDISRFCSFTNQPSAFAAIFYENAATSIAPQTTSAPLQDTTCQNDALSLSIPAFPQTPPPGPETTTRIDMEFGPNATGQLVWSMNNQSFRANYDNPLLLLANAGNTTYPTHPEWNVYTYTSTTSIRLHLASTAPLPHPMHLHGHNFWVIAEGLGDWDGTTTRPANPQRRDTHLMRKSSPLTGQRSFLVVEFRADNPGVWPMHCHNGWHLSGGMYVNIMEHPDVIEREMRIPGVMGETCREWARFTGRNVVDQIDAGV